MEDVLAGGGAGMREAMALWRVEFGALNSAKPREVLNCDS
jgi:hypothetical protein